MEQSGWSLRLQLRPCGKFALIAGKTGEFFRIFYFRLARDFSRICAERFPVQYGSGSWQRIADPGRGTRTAQADEFTKPNFTKDGD